MTKTQYQAPPLTEQPPPQEQRTARGTDGGPPKNSEQLVVLMVDGRAQGPRTANSCGCSVRQGPQEQRTVVAAL